MHGSHNRREKQGDDCAGALVRCSSAWVHGGKRVGSPNVAGLPFHNQPINERGSHERCHEGDVANHRRPPCEAASLRSGAASTDRATDPARRRCISALCSRDASTYRPAASRWIRRSACRDGSRHDAASCSSFGVSRPFAAAVTIRAKALRCRCSRMTRLRGRIGLRTAISSLRLARGGLGLAALFGRKLHGAIDMVKANAKTMLARRNDHTLCHIWRHRLPPLVVANVSLRATQLGGKRLLRHLQTLSDLANSVHAPILAPLVGAVNTGATSAHSSRNNNQ